jgi:hypothetical protein
VRPQRLARIGGALYLVIIALGLFGEAVVRGTVVVPDGDAATAANVAAHESLWRLGIATELVLACAEGFG